MTMLTSRNLVAFALIAIAPITFSLVGCSRDGEPRGAQQPAASESTEFARMNDPEYVAKLDASVDARKQLLATRARLEEQMAAEGADRESLQARIDDLDKALEDERKRAMATVRQRLMSDEQKGSSAQ